MLLEGIIMTKVISVHEYVLKPSVETGTFERAVLGAEERGLFQLPGLIGYHMLKGIKGSRAGRYAAIWIYESREAWEKLWGSPEHPRQKGEYPQNWRIWEEEILSPFLTQESDEIQFTAYEEWLAVA
jgi:heme-degrading monooxygenase HmoA